MAVILCADHEYVYFKEYIETFLEKNRLVLYNGSTEPFSENVMYVCIRRIPFNLLPPKCFLSFINTEQLSVPSKFLEYKMHVRPNIRIFDYSLQNIKISGIGHYLPYKENPNETIKLKEFLEQPKEFDFAVIGTMSEYRRNIMKTVSSKGYKVYFVSGWGDARDKEVGKCKALLNIHFNGDYKLYEPIRCERWRFAGMPIFSEECIDEVPSEIVIVKDFSEITLDK
jgi:hypothetical protein